MENLKQQDQKLKFWDRVKLLFGSPLQINVTINITPPSLDEGNGYVVPDKGQYDIEGVDPLPSPETFEEQEEQALKEEEPEPPVEVDKPEEELPTTPMEEAIKPPTEIICGFPGIGKTHFYKQSEGRALDSDSSNFSWIHEEGKDRVRNPAFPVNYINHIKENLGKVDIILVSSHKEVRDALVAEGLHFTLIYPDKNEKEELLTRYRERGSDASFLKLLDLNWNKFMTDMAGQIDCNHVVLPPETYLSDYLTEIDSKNQES